MDLSRVEDPAIFLKNCSGGLVYDMFVLPPVMMAKLC
ncbi:hypothetical protein V6Z12_D09G169300 [Gossypium hirsutum]